MSGMTRALKRRIFLRGLFIQSGWNFERMQNVGFAWCLESWIKRVHPDAGARQAAYRRHLEFFNTQPYMAGFVVGVAGRLEEEAARAPESAKRIESLKRAMGSALAGLGDSLFWGALKPACAVAAMAVGWTLSALGAPPAASLVSSILFYLVTFNAPALWVRWRGLSLGYELGEGVVAELKRMQWQQKVRWIRGAGFLIAMVLTAGPIFSSSVGASYVRLYAAALAVCLGMKSFGLRSAPAYGILLIGSLIIAWVGT
ncbi:MAG: PTS system mannose/fructose/sorbose family transporter subunit IID [Elusimicrobia bacterium]|nr:PTS system mannose/fructose/sorbose family transporter subunit IID [Elusimicrobiota bacterium]